MPSRENAYWRNIASQSAVIAFAAYFLLLFSHLPLTLSIAIHKSAVHCFKRYQREHTLQLIFEEQAFAKLEWQIPDREFAWKGDMYDVIRLESKGTQKVVTCFKDVYESYLLRLLRNTSRDISQSFASFITHIQLYFEAIPALPVADTFVKWRALPEPTMLQPFNLYEHFYPPPEKSFF